MSIFTVKSNLRVLSSKSIRLYTPSVLACVFLVICTITAHGFLPELRMPLATVLLLSLVFISILTVLTATLRNSECDVEGSYKRRRHKLAVTTVTIMLSAYGFTSWQVDLQRNSWIPATQEGVEVQVRGTVAEMPVAKDGYVKFLMRLDQGQVLANTDFKLNGYMVLSCYRCELTFKAGEIWQVLVKLKRPHGYASWGAFDYEKYLFRKSVVATGYLKHQESAIKLAASNWRFQVETLRSRVLKNLRVASSSINSEQGSDSGDRSNENVGLNVMLALTLGYKTDFSKDNKQVFQSVGVAHLMVISGLHIGLIFALANWLLNRCVNCFPQIMNRYVRQNIVVLPAMTLALLYAALAGFSIPTQRALLMLAIYSALRFIGRDASLLQILIASAVIIVLFDVFAVLDVGFWMSFSAVFIIAVWQLATQREANALVDDPEQTHTQLHERLAGENPQRSESIWQRGWRSAQQLFRLQLCLVVALIPITSLLFGQISLSAIVVNLIAIPIFSLVIIPLTLLLTGLATGWPDATFVIYFIGLLQLCLMHIYTVFEAIADVPFSSLRLPRANMAVTLIAVLITSMLLLGKRMWSMLTFVSAYVVGCLLWSSQTLEHPVVSLLDVGQGLTMVVRHQDKTLVYDVGPRYRTGFNTAEAVLLPYLVERGVRHVDKLIISHADNDHIGGYDVFTQAMSVGDVLTSRVDKIPIASECLAGTHWNWGELEFEILSPSKNTPIGSNNLSCVLMLKYYDTRVLLTGDIERPVERYLLEQGVNVQADIVLVPHQGSQTSSIAAFIDAVNPALGLIAAGYRNQYRHPHGSVVKRYTERGIELLQTPMHGSVEITLDQRSWSARSYRQSHPRPWRTAY